MGLLTKSLGFKALSMEDPAQPLLPYSALFESLGLGRSDAGVMVNERQALRLSTAWACIQITSTDLARLSLEIFQQMHDGSMHLAPSHRCYNLLRTRPNPNMSSMVWRVAMIASRQSYGNAYSWIKRDGAARVIALVPLDSSKTGPVWVDGRMLYGTTQTADGRTAFIEAENMLHFRGLSLDGITGLSPIQTCKNAFGLGLAAEKFGAQLFGNGARASGVLSHPGELGDEAYERLKKSVQEWATGDQALRPIILEEGLKWEQITISPDDAQFLETRKFQREEVAAIYRVPMHLLQSLERATNNNIEHQSLDYVRYCLAPIAVEFEQETTFKLLSGPFTVEHNLNELQRGDFKSQTEGFQILRNIGVYSTNDVLRDMRKNPISADEGGDVRTVQGAMIPLTALVDGTYPGAQQPDGGDGDLGSPAASAHVQIRNVFRRLLRDAVGRVTNRANRDAGFVRGVFRPIVSSMALAIIARRFGTSELTARDEALISRQLDGVASEAAAWSRDDAGAVAERLTDGLAHALGGEILAGYLPSGQ